MDGAAHVPISRRGRPGGHSSAGSLPAMATPPAAQRRARDRRTHDAAATPGRHGVLTRKALLRLGWTDRAIAVRVETGAWLRLHDGILLVQPHCTDAARVRAAWLAGGRGAAVAGLAAAHLLGLAADPPGIVDVLVPHPRTPARREGVRFHRRRRRIRARWLEGVRVTAAADTVVDLVEWAATDVDAVGWIHEACRRRITTPGRILAAAAERERLRRRRLLVATCGEAARGITSPLERWYARDVAAAHGLPQGRRQVRHRFGARTAYSDVELERYSVVVELDGRLGHEELEFRDMWRDNAHAAEGRATLRYGWRDVTSSPCEAASQVARVLSTRGWTGRLRPCGPGCLASLGAAA